MLEAGPSKYEVSIRAVSTLRVQIDCVAPQTLRAIFAIVFVE